MQFDVKIRKVIENGKPLKAVASVTVLLLSTMSE